MRICNMEVIIRLGNKVYTFGAKSGIGKTYLFKLLEEYNRESCNKGRCLFITYYEGMTTATVIKQIKDFSGELVFLDNFELYYDKSIALALVNKGIPTLLDLKNYVYLNEFAVRPAIIKREKECLEVIGL